MKWYFNRNCWTGACTQLSCLKVKPFIDNFKTLFAKNQKFRFWKYQELQRESPEGKKTWLYHGFGKPDVLSLKSYIKRLQHLLYGYIPHLIALNFGNEQLRRVTDLNSPRVPKGDPLVGIDFSSSPNFARANMSQHDYQNGQTFGLLSFVAFWVDHTLTLKKAVFPMVFVDPSHSVERVCQGLDYGLLELESHMSLDNVKLKNLYIYSDCAPGDQKNKYFLCLLSDLETKDGEWLPSRYFNRAGNHNKFVFDSEAGLWKHKYFKAAFIIKIRSCGLRWFDRRW